VPIELVDIGVNLAHDSFDHDRSAVIERAGAAGVTHLIVTGSTLASTHRAIAMARERPDVVRATAGVHPHHAADLDATQLPQLRELLQAAEVCAAGECGLDYFRNFSPRDAQQRAFRWQLELAIESGKPAFLHQRDAHAEFLAIVREHRPQLTGAVAHCFTGGVGELEDYLALDLYIGITGWVCDERRGALLREAMSRIPADRLLLETDAPYLLPRDLQPRPASRRNEPMYLRHVLETVARRRNEPLEAVARASTDNARRLFGWPSRHVPDRVSRYSS
jgi:TatD DNase family protein